jgi:hypothetical protein
VGGGSGRLTAAPVFRFVQLEFPWALGPADGRYVVRAEAALGAGGGGAPHGGDADGAPPPATHVIVVKTLGAPERRWLRSRRGQRSSNGAESDGVLEPTPVTTGRVTIIDAESSDATAAEAWLAAAGTSTAEDVVGDLARLVGAHRVSAGDPGAPIPHLGQALVARAGYGIGDEVADGRWSEARELPLPSDERKRRRSVALRPQERLAALLSGRSRALACEELTLRARHDLDHGHLREAALQLRTALDAALGELPATAVAADLAERVEELRGMREGVAALADAAIGGVMPPDARDELERPLTRLEAALRARVVAEGNR